MTRLIGLRLGLCALREGSIAQNAEAKKGKEKRHGTMDFLMARFLDSNSYEPSLASSTTYMGPRVRKVLVESVELQPRPAPLFLDLLTDTTLTPNEVTIYDPLEPSSPAVPALPPPPPTTANETNKKGSVDHHIPKP